ncbi:MAG: phosphoribosylanthranilate isomerase [Cyanobacteria bacterium REEB459]|nr:phosphoribosylanthranilate isomerase [Cyanobacteria bacterium REEB459]
MRVKICGITRLDQALEIAALGATDLGFICVPRSPRYLPVDHLGQLLGGLRHGQVRVGMVGVVADRSLASLQAIVEQTGLSALQLHGDETPEDCRQIRQTLPGCELIKAIRVATRADLERALTYADWVDALLLDAYHPSSLGGTGLTLDWASLTNFRPPCRWFLAGGLSPDNIQKALEDLSPDGIDLSSGLEVRPGWKDLALVDRLFQRLGPWLT